MSDCVRLSTAFREIAHYARTNDLAPPVIETDWYSAHILIKLIERCLGAPAGRLLSADGNAQVGMFAGIKIVARRDETCKHTVDGWREHFGPLAEIWS